MRRVCNFNPSYFTVVCLFVSEVSMTKEREVEEMEEKERGYCEGERERSSKTK